MDGEEHRDRVAPPRRGGALQDDAEKSRRGGGVGGVRAARVRVRARRLDGLDAGTADHDTVGAPDANAALKAGTADDHARAEAVAVKAATAAIRKIASGANMKGMVRMGSSNALQALGMDAKPPTKPQQKNTTDDEAAAPKEEDAANEDARSRGAFAAARGFRPPRTSGNSDSSDASSLASDAAASMAIHRVPSRSGNISSMVKVASFGNLGVAGRELGSLNDLSHAGAPGAGGAKKSSRLSGGSRVEKPAGSPGGDDEPADEEAAKPPEDDASDEETWADMSLLVISSGGNGGGDEDERE